MHALGLAILHVPGPRIPSTIPIQSCSQPTHCPVQVSQYLQPSALGTHSNSTLWGLLESHEEVRRLRTSPHRMLSTLPSHDPCFLPQVLWIQSDSMPPPESQSRVPLSFRHSPKVIKPHGTPLTACLPSEDGHTQLDPTSRTLHFTDWLEALMHEEGCTPSRISSTQQLLRRDLGLAVPHM